MLSCEIHAADGNTLAFACVKHAARAPDEAPTPGFAIATVTFAQKPGTAQCNGSLFTGHINY